MTKKTAFTEAKKFVGAKVKDTVTGMEGTCTGIAIYDKNYNCIRCQVDRLDSTGNLSSWWMDHTRLEIVEPAEPAEPAED